jgi:hypothetical protein
MGSRIRKLAVAAGVLTATAATLWATLAPRRTATLAYVAVAGNNHVRVIDLATGETLRRIYSGTTPWRLLVSPDRKRLWVQHWSAGTTAVVDLEDHEIVRVLPFRGPGRFSADGAQLLTFDWPGSALHVVDAGSFATVRETVTEVAQVYDLAPDPDGATLHLVQHDPMVRGPHERYAYVVSYPWREKDPARARPASLRTGLSPAAVRAVRTGPFLITADRETNGLTLLNKLGDGRAVPTCPAPQAVFLAPDERRMAVICWRGDGARQSQLVLYRTDFSTRPWPAITQAGTATLNGALVAGAFSPRGDQLFALDRASGLLLEADPETLELRRQIPVGDVPVDLAIVDVPQQSRDRAADDSRARRTLKDLLTRMRAQAKPFTDLSWIETVTARDPAAPQGRRQRVSFQPPDRLRVEDEHGSLRLSARGDSLSVEPDGRFRVAPRQELLSLLWGLSTLPVDEAVRLLAGDVPGSPWLRGGLAVDLVTEVTDPGGARSVLLGASRPGERVSQLWADAETGRVTNMVEQFPVFRTRGHQDGGFGGLLETKLYDMKEAAPGVWVPGRLERVADGKVIQDVRIEGVLANRRLPGELFDLARLGGISLRPAAPPATGTSAAWLADWGVHRLPVPPEFQLHNLEHGGVVLQYNCPEGCPTLVTRLEEIARNRDLVLVAPYPLMEPGLVLTAWGRSERLESFDEAKILAFLDAWAGKRQHEAGGETRLEMARAH